MKIVFDAEIEELGRCGLLPEEIQDLKAEVIARPIENQYWCHEGHIVLQIEGKAYVFSLDDLASVVAAFKVQFSD